MDITLTAEEYSALVSLGRIGTASMATDPRVAQDRVIRFEDFLRSIERRNNITRYLLWVQWQETDQSLPPGTRFPETWPPNQRAKIERLDRPIIRADVDAVLAAQARKPVTILVTIDPAGLVGWTQIDQYFNNGS